MRNKKLHTPFVLTLRLRSGGTASLAAEALAKAGSKHVLIKNNHLKFLINLRTKLTRACFDPAVASSKLWRAGWAFTPEFCRRVSTNGYLSSFRKALILFVLAIPTMQLGTPLLTFIIPFCSVDPVMPFIYDLTAQPFFASSEFIFISWDYTQEQLEGINDCVNNFANIKCIASPDRQHASALHNCACQAATAPYLTLHYVGDYRDAQHLYKQLEALKQNESLDLVYSDYYTTCQRQGYQNVAQKWYPVDVPEFAPYRLSGNIFGTHCVWRKSLHTRYGYFMETLMYEFWWEFWNRCAAQGAIFKKTPGNAGNRFLDYFDTRRLFSNDQEMDRGYQEDRYIRQTYAPLWDHYYDFPEKPFVIIIASYKNKNWYKRNLNSVFNQHYGNYRVIYIDDCSPDATGKLVEEYIDTLQKNDRVLLIRNTDRRGATANLYTMAHLCKPEEIVVILDGDDWLAHDRVLNHLNAIYQDPFIWLTYGQFQWWPSGVHGFCQPIPTQIRNQNKIREYGWVTTHLRSFYAGLYHRIKQEDLMYEGKFFSMTGDLAITFPMIEMAGYHCKFVSEILYIYNTESSINDHKVDGNRQVNLGSVIRSREKYQPLAHL